MKKIIFSGLLAAAAFTISAQEITMYRVHNPNTVNTVTTTTVVEVPPYIHSEFLADHPDVTVISWEPMGIWWKAAYNKDNRITNVFYNDAGDIYYVALPVLHNSVPEDVIATALEQYGTAVYGLSTMKNADGDIIYQVHLIENETSRMTWIDGRGSEVKNVFRDKYADDDDAMTMNQ